MADQKVSDLTQLSAVPDATDELLVVDKSDTTMAASGSDKRLQFSNLFDWAESGDLATVDAGDAAAAGSSTEIPRADHQHAVATAAAVTISGTNAEGTSTNLARADHNHTLPQMAAYGPVLAGSLASVATGSTNQWYSQFYWIPTTTLSGIRYRVGATKNGNARAALYNVSGTKVADRTSDFTGGTANLVANVPFDSTYAAAAGLYYCLVWFASATHTFFGGRFLTTTENGTNATTTPTSVSAIAGVENADRPMLMPY